jgi:shikimate kinase
VKKARRKSSHKKATVSVNAVFLVGFMGAGKTSVGRALGQRLNWIFEDLDDRIERLEGRTVAEIFRDSGEAAFRQAERTALEQVLNELQAGSVRIIAMGGGAFVQPENAALLKDGNVATVFLDAPVDELWQRCSEQMREKGASRPLLQSAKQFRDLHKMRRKHYLRASVRIDAGSRTVEAIASEIAATLGLKKVVLRIEQGEVE